MATHENVALLMAMLRRERRWQERRKAAGKAIEKFTVAQLSFAVAALINGWLSMLAVGVAHGEWLRYLPTIGYWWAVLIMWLMHAALRTSLAASS